MGDARAHVGIGAPVPEHLALARDDAAVLVDAGLDAQGARVLGDLIELLLHRERDLHRPPHQHGACRHQRLELDVELRAVAAAQERHLDAHPVLRPAEQPRHLGAHERRPLRAGVDGDVLVTRIGDRGERLEGEMQALLGAELVFEHMSGLGEGLVHVTAAQPGVDREISRLEPLEMLEVSEASRRLELVVDEDLGGHRLDLVVDRRQFLVLGNDLLRRGVRHMWVGGEHHRDRLADEADLVDR